MYKYSLLILILILPSCSWDKKNTPNITSSEINVIQEEIQNEIEQEKAKEIIATLSGSIITQSGSEAIDVLSDFLNKKELNFGAEITKTYNHYQDNLGPILEFEHEETEETASGSTLTGSTFTGSTSTGALDSTDTLLSGSLISVINQDDITNISLEPKETKNYSEESNTQKITEATPVTTDDIKQFEISSKVGKSGTYTMYIGVQDICDGGLEMTDTENNKKSLFKNSCEKRIYNFELMVGQIKIFYYDKKDEEQEEIISL
ncbi:MAG: hypothetical protein GY828_02640 [Candidatus Gracilibacteria bacterium]|nr:hypothetical protein [Candidatus Gracilibacteria bacterium]